MWRNYILYLLPFQVQKLGFLNIDCLEPCTSMRIRQPEGLYGKVYEEIVSHKKPSSIATGKCKGVKFVILKCMGMSPCHHPHVDI